MELQKNLEKTRGLQIIILVVILKITSCKSMQKKERKKEKS
jgi:hypothetical protein